jgi:hypothetical protein
MSTLERIIASLEKLREKHILDGDHERAANVKTVLDKIKKRFNEAL